jgi:hypothetical protein
MELTSADWLILVDDAFDQMLSKAESLGARVSVVPALPGANSVYAIVTHCVGVCRWWIEHAILGRPTDRDRDGEFNAEGTVEELRELVDGLRASLADLLRAVEPTPVPLAPTRPSRVQSGEGGHGVSAGSWLTSSRNCSNTPAISTSRQA